MVATTMLVPLRHNDVVFLSHPAGQHCLHTGDTTPALWTGGKIGLQPQNLLTEDLYNKLLCNMQDESHIL